MSWQHIIFTYFQVAFIYSKFVFLPHLFNAMFELFVCFCVLEAMEQQKLFRQFNLSFHNYIPVSITSASLHWLSGLL